MEASSRPWQTAGRCGATVVVLVVGLFTACGGGEEALVTPTPTGTPTTTITATASPTLTPTPPVPVPTRTPETTPAPTPTPRSRFSVGDAVEVNTGSQDRLILRKASSVNAPELRRVYNGTRLTLVDGPKIVGSLTWWGLEGGGWCTEDLLQAPGEAPIPPRFLKGAKIEVNTGSAEELPLRKEPDLSAAEARRVANGTLLVISGDPITADELVWWPMEGGGWAPQPFIQYPGDFPLPPKPPATPTSTPAPFDPNVARAIEGTVWLFYGLLDEGAYETAWLLLSSSYRARHPFSEWVAGYSTTLWITTEHAKARSTTPPVVDFQVSAGDYINGGVVSRRWQGTWYLMMEGGAWRLDRVDVHEVP